MLVGAIVALVVSAGPGEKPAASEWELIPAPAPRVSVAQGATSPAPTSSAAPAAPPTAEAATTANPIAPAPSTSTATPAPAGPAAPAPTAPPAPPEAATAALGYPALPSAPPGPALADSGPVLLSRAARPGGRALERLIEPSGEIVEHEVNAAGTVQSCRKVGALQELRIVAQHPAGGGEFLQVARDASGALVQYVVSPDGEPRAVALLAPAP